ncbi:MAG: hypothetical protein JWQ76_3450 [Ramlibacter sp.]|nr:hypothetical protein [Ramlibacter sp.]
MDGDTSQDMRYAPPQAHVEDVAAPEAGLVLAGRGERLRATLVDVVIALLAWWIASRLASFSPWAADGSWPALLLTALVGFVMFAAIHGHSLATRGQTLGKRVVGIRITRPDGSAASLGRLLGLRYGVGYLLTMVPVLGQAFALIDVLLIFRESRRCLHDLIADTIVVKA